MDNIGRLAERFRHVFRLISRQADALSDKDAPTRAEVMVMAWLDERGAMAPAALAAAHRVRPQTMGQMLDALAARRWIRRADHPTDRRQILVSLTPSGTRALARGRQARQAWLTGKFRKLPAAERKTIAAALGILERFFEDQPPSDQAPS